MAKEARSEAHRGANTESHTTCPSAGSGPDSTSHQSNELKRETNAAGCFTNHWPFSIAGGATGLERAKAIAEWICRPALLRSGAELHRGGCQFHAYVCHSCRRFER